MTGVTDPTAEELRISELEMCLAERCDAVDALLEYVEAGPKAGDLGDVLRAMVVQTIRQNNHRARAVLAPEPEAPADE